MSEKWKKMFLYAGLSKEEYLSILPDIRLQNQRDLKAYCTVVALLLGANCIAVLITSAFNYSTAFSYFLGFAFSLLLLFLSGHTGHFPALENNLKYVFVSMVYLFGILVTLAQPESLAVLFMVILVLVPLIFSDRPCIIAIYTIIAAAVFIICENIFKDSRIVSVDIWNTITYGLLGILVGIIIQQVRLQNLLQLREIAKLSESDLLTGLKNRNSFEQNPAVYGNALIRDITCIYADVNGLHELNNTQGHHAGDVMLQSVAGAILNQYGRDHSYRVGGDEFVVFAFGEDSAETRQKIDEMMKECEQKGYHVSFGYACGQENELNLDNLIRTAEERMYLAKAEYYRQRGIERLSRR